MTIGHAEISMNIIMATQSRRLTFVLQFYESWILINDENDDRRSCW